MGCTFVPSCTLHTIMVWAAQLWHGSLYYCMGQFSKLHIFPVSFSTWLFISLPPSLLHSLPPSLPPSLLPLLPPSLPQTILNSLCSIYITFSQGEEMEGAPLSQQQQADCLPGQSQLEHITSAVLGHVTSPDNPLTTVIQGLKVIFSISQYNAGLVHLFR